MNRSTLAPRTKPIRWLMIALAALTLGACTASDSEAPDADGRANVTRPKSEGEILLAEAPPGWKKVNSTEAATVRLVEFVAPRSPVGDWIEKMAFESMTGGDLPDPIAFIKALVSDQAKTCRNLESHTTYSGLENGYPTNVHLLVCDFNPLLNKGQVTMLKVIRGNDYFYTISRARRVPGFDIAAGGSSGMTDEEMVRWSAHMRAISVCDTQREEHPCPESSAG